MEGTCLGIDVAGRTLACSFRGRSREFANTEEGRRELALWAEGSKVWCMEATGRHHEALALEGLRLGRRCVVVNPMRAKRYLECVSPRAKTDRVDAAALARLGEAEGHRLRAWSPEPEESRAARQILGRRKALVAARVSLRQVARDTGDPEGRLKTVLDEMKRQVEALERDLERALSGNRTWRHLRTIPGVGSLTAAAVACALARGEFATSDSLVAYAGLDPRPRDSGSHRGRRRLSHQGDATLRTLLFMAARTGARLPVWQPYFQRQLGKGLSKTEATVVLARKLARVCWSVAKGDHPFEPPQTPEVDKAT
jgi:transposase